MQRGSSLLFVGLSLLVTHGASAQVELTGTFIRYLRVATNGALVDPGMARSTAYSEAGGTADQSCDLYGPGSPAAGFTVVATPAGGTRVTGSNNNVTSDVATTSGPTVSGRSIVWNGRFTSGSVNLAVSQTFSYQTADRFATIVVELRNDGTTRLDDVYYFFSGDPDHGQCNIGTAFETNNDVVRQQPTNTSSLATATAGSPTTYTLALASPDSRSRANNGGFGNTDAVTAWNMPVDSAGMLRDEDIGIVFREQTLAPGATTAFIIYMVWGRSVAEASSRFDTAVGLSINRELNGTFIRYLRLGANGALVDATMTPPRSTAYSEAGGPADQSCDLYGPGSPVHVFTLNATPAGGVAASASNSNSMTGITTISGPFVAGRQLRWSGRWRSGLIDLTVDQTYRYAVGDRVARLQTRLTNTGTVALSNVYYLFSGDPDHGSCGASPTSFTTNDVLRQQPADGTAFATAGVTTPFAYVYGLGTADTRGRANNSGFGNTDAPMAWNMPQDRNNMMVDEDTALGFRETLLAPGATTTFEMFLSWGRTAAESESRFRTAAGLAVGLPNGSPCTMGTACTSGNCVDGVCCNTACGGGSILDCQACSVGAGAAVNGTCGTSRAGTECRPAGGACDVAETCNGTSTTCPADGFVAAGTLCRASAGGCDVVESCSGTSAVCPPNVFAPAGMVCRPPTDDCDAPENCTGASADCPADGFVAAGIACRPSVGPCDVAESCTGAGSACPTDGFVAAGTECRTTAGPCDVAESCTGTDGACPADAFAGPGMECRASAGACDVAEACTGTGAACPTDAFVPDGSGCGDGMACNGDEICRAGACSPGMAPFCDDGDECTADACAEPDGCASTPIDGCCRTDGECDDGDACTTDTCSGNACNSEPIPGCGGTDSGVPGTDSGVPPSDGGVTVDGGERPPIAGGCGCRGAGGSGHGPVFGLLLVVAVMAVRRRRR